MATLSKADFEVVTSTIFFGSLPAAIGKSLISRSRVIDLAPGQRLFHEGEPADAVFAVLAGLVKLTVERRDGREVLVETFHAGTSFAEALAFGGEAYPVSATAIVQTRVLVSPNHVIRHEFRKNPDAVESILAATYRHLHSLVRQIEELKGNTGLERLARYILAKLDETDGETEIEIPFDKKVLASFLGLKPESLSRAFRRLADYGVSTERRFIRVREADALREFFDH